MQGNNNDKNTALWKRRPFILYRESCVNSKGLFLIYKDTGEPVEVDRVRKGF